MQPNPPRDRALREQFVRTFVAYIAALYDCPNLAALARSLDETRFRTLLLVISMPECAVDDDQLELADELDDDLPNDLRVIVDAASDVLDWDSQLPDEWDLCVVPAWRKIMDLPLVWS